MVVVSRQSSVAVQVLEITVSNIELVEEVVINEVVVIVDVLLLPDVSASGFLSLLLAKTCSTAGPAGTLCTISAAVILWLHPICFVSYSPSDILSNLFRHLFNHTSKGRSA